MRATEPTVSVVFPVYNEPVETLRLSVESLISQSFDDFEVIVVDDSTAGETTALLESYAKRDPRFRILRPSASRGLAAALNFGIALARGKYIARADADDIQERERLQSQVAFMEANPDIGVLGSAITKISSEGQECGRRAYPLSHENIHRVSCIKSPVCHPAVTIRKEILVRHGGYDASFQRAEDYELWLRLLRRGVRFANLEEPLVRLRLAPRRSVGHWRLNLIAKLRHFSFNHVAARVFGIALVGAYCLIPGTLQDVFYRFHNKS